MGKLWKAIKGTAVFCAGAAVVVSGISYKLFADTMKRGRRLPIQAEEGKEDNPYDRLYRMGKDWAVANKGCCRRLTVENEGISLVGYYYNQGGHKTAILIHGLTGTYLDRLSSAAFYFEKGYNVLAVDCRGHGESGGEYRTLGYWDSQDIIVWANFLAKELSQEHLILDGTSMGGAAVLSAGGDEKLPQEVAGIVSDASFTSIHDIFAYQTKYLLKLPVVPLLNMVELYCNKLANVSMLARSPVDSMKRMKVPVLLIHGGKDSFVPYEMARRLRDACASSKRLFTVKEAGHGDACLVDARGYHQVLGEFLDTLLQ